MNRARFAAGVSAAPVVQAEGKIALLLDFGEDDAGAERVYGTGRHEDAVTGVNFVNVQEFFEVTAAEGLLEHFRGNSGLESAADAGTGFGVQNDPRFRLAVFDRVPRFCLLIVGMHLKGEPVVGIEEFDEQRELSEVLVFSEEFAGVTLEKFGE